MTLRFCLLLEPQDTHSQGLRQQNDSITIASSIVVGTQECHFSTKSGLGRKLIERPGL